MICSTKVMIRRQTTHNGLLTVKFEWDSFSKKCIFIRYRRMAA
jgi:hypothetical protein